MILRLIPIAASLLFTWLHIFSGTTLALIVTVAMQFFYAGFLLVRVLGKGQQGHPLWRFAWVLASAFALAITLGGFSRLWLIPVSHYVLVCHGILAVLAVLPARTPDPAPAWTIGKHNIAYLLLVAFCCVVILGVGLARNQIRFDGYEDQTVFIELADWLSDEPENRSLDSRRVGLPESATRWDFDGWTYTHAVWSWSSGVPASQIIWFDLTWLFVWTVPIAVFGMAYELTRKESTATWSVVGLTLFGLMTIDSLATYNSTLTFGQFSLFQMNSLRTFTTALLSPLALMVMLSYVRKPDWASLLLSLLMGIAVGMSHARPAMTLIYTISATTALWWLVHPTRSRLLTSAALAGVLAIVLMLPAIQKPPTLAAIAPAAQETTSNPTEEPTPATTEILAVTPTPPASVETPQDTTLDAGEFSASADPRGELIELNLPLIGDTFIVNPSSIFYHPVILFAAVMGVMAVIDWRRSLAAAFVFASTITTLIFLFTPGITPIMTAITSRTVIASLVFAIPIPLILGMSLNDLLERLPLSKHDPARLQWIASLCAVFAILMLLFEPIPIPASAADQIRASNAIQFQRAMRETDARLVATLRQLVPQDTPTVFLTPHRIANFISEDIPLAMVTGGRHQGNEAFSGTTRFFPESTRVSPWLDADDLTYLQTWGVTHIVAEVDDTRAPQLLLMPNRFQLQAASDGYLIFEVRENLQPDATDRLFADMNALYRNSANPRWTPDGYNPILPGDESLWQPIISEWEARPEEALSRLGLAFAQLMAGNDSAAYGYWRALADDDPGMAFFVPAVAATQFTTQGPEAAKQTLVSALESSTSTVQIIAARTLLSEYYFYLLSDDDLTLLVDRIQQNLLLWTQLAVDDKADSVRQSVALMLTRQRWDIAEQWHLALVDPIMDPRDYVTRASIALVQGDMPRAITILEPATQPDLTLANRYIHPDRWQNNVAEQLWQLLNTTESVTFDAQIADAGEEITSFASPRLIADANRMYVVEAAVEPMSQNALRIGVTFGNPHIQPFAVMRWQIQVVHAETLETYADVSRPAFYHNPLLTRTLFEIELPPDIPTDTPGLVVIKTMYDERVVFETIYIPVTLHPAEAQTSP